MKEFFNEDFVETKMPAMTILNHIGLSESYEDIRNLYVKYYEPISNSFREIEIEGFLNDDSYIYLMDSVFRYKYQIELYKTNEDNYDSELIGKIDFVYFDCNYSTEELHEWADEISGDDEAVMSQVESLLESEDRYEINSGDFYVSAICIEEQYRGKGYGTLLMDMLFGVIANRTCMYSEDLSERSKIYLTVPSEKALGDKAKKFYKSLVKKNIFKEYSEYKRILILN